MTTTDTPSTDALPTWKCTICGCIKHKEEEVICWNCGKGEMIYQRPTTDTPRTDAILMECPSHLQEVALANLALDLELELAHSLANQVTAQAEIERLRAINADMRNFLAKAIHNEGFNEDQALKFIYQ